MKNLQLLLPVRDIYVTQPFAVNYLDFYQKLGMKGHNGIDFKTNDSCPVFASHDGIITGIGADEGAGIYVNITEHPEGLSFYTVYYHLKETKVLLNQKVKAGQIIALADNTGKYTTGNHLHFGMKEILNGQTINKDNGYNGAIDPSPYFPKNWNKTPAEMFYGRRRNLKEEVKVMIALRKYLKRLPKWDEINSCVYGAWNREAVANPAMRYNWSYLTKTAFLNGKIPFK